ncbi:MAG: TlpA disulfide reductase family protein [Bacteroidota bacterium]
MTRRSGGVLTALLLCSFVLPAGCASSSGTGKSAKAGKEAGKKNKKVGAPMPSVVVRELDSKRKIDLGALQGKVVLVDIWASWCAPCMEEMPLLDEMATRLKKKGVEIIAVSVDEDKESAQSFLSSRPSWALTVAHDPEGKVPQILRPSKMPTSYVVDADGIIRFVNEGFERGDVKVLESRLKTLAGDES